MDDENQGGVIGKKQSAFALAALGLLGQVGCLTIVVIAVSIAGGLLLDSYFGTRPWITVALLIASVPVTLFLMFKLVLSFAPKMQMNALPKKSNQPQQNPLQEEEPLGNHQGES